MVAKRLDLRAMLAGDGFLTRDEADALGREYRAGESAEVLAGFAKGRAAHIARTRGVDGVSHAELSRMWGVSDAHVSQSAKSASYLALAGFDLADNATARLTGDVPRKVKPGAEPQTETVNVWHLADRMRKVSYGRGEGETAKSAQVKVVLSTVNGDAQAFADALVVLQDDASAYRESKSPAQGVAEASRPGAAEGHAGAVADDVAGAKTAWLATLRTLATQAEAGAFALTSAEVAEVDDLLIRVMAATVGERAAA